jgi:hypothetical protein
MSYLDQGYSKLLYKSTYTASKELTEAEASMAVSVLTGSSINGGSSSSPDGKLKIDWANGNITFSDGAYPRIFIGNTT